ncbi:MAG TPA: EAL domain-containing protein [Acidimicrobiia bacterium]|nr:EAL domain-containing protein [Acidimicrobiia bacterium]
MTREADAVRVACTDQVHRSLARTSLGGIPASSLLVLILGSSVSLGARIAFVSLISGADVIMFVIARRYLAARRAGTPPPRKWCTPAGVGLIGAAWGSLALMGMPDRVELRAVYLLFVCGTSATYVVGTAARRLYYYCSQLPMLVPVAVAFVASDNRFTHLLGFGVPVYFAVMTTLFLDVHRLVISEVQLRAQKEQATHRLQDANSALVQRALRDELTGLANRAAFIDRLEGAVERAWEDCSTVAVLYVDIDRFKVVNDSLGHGGGDELLIAIAQRLQRTMRSDDLVARLGGDEFTVLMERLHHKGEPFAIAQRVAGVFERPFDVAGRHITVTASIGVASNSSEAADAEALLSCADAAQYEAKQAGRNRIEVFDGGMRDAIHRRLGNEQELRDALNAGELVAWYQPEVDIATGSITGAEALARWQHPTRGTLDAGAFISIADEAGLTYALDDAVISASVRERSYLSAEALAADDFRLWCNVGYDQLTRAKPAARLANLLTRVGCRPAHIGIEITETAALHDIDAVAAEAHSARELGIHVALDDFGTGHSSLTLLRSLPIDRVKIDRSFIKDITTQPRDAAIVANLISLAHDIGIEVVAEGVETPEQAMKLLELGCRRAQGWLWAKALPPGELEARLLAQGGQPLRAFPPGHHALAGTPAHGSGIVGCGPNGGMTTVSPRG